MFDYVWQGVPGVLVLLRHDRMADQDVLRVLASVADDDAQVFRGSEIVLEVPGDVLDGEGIGGNRVECPCR